MEKESRLRLMCCPQCARGLKIAEGTKKVICPYCESLVHPIPGTPQFPKTADDCTEQLNSVAAAVSYVHFCFETFDWDAWLLTHNYTLAKVDKVIRRFVQIAATEKATWLLAFDSVCIPVLKKAQGIPAVLDKAASLLLDGNRREAAALLDSLQQAVRFLKDNENEILRQLVGFTENARRCTADEDELTTLYEKIQTVRTALQELQVPNTPEEIAAVKTAADENNTILCEQFAEIGIDLEIEYRRVGNFLNQKQYADAISLLQRISGYKNTKTLLKEVTRRYQFREVLQITGRLYVYRANDKFGGSLYAVENGKTAAEPIVKGISQILAVYADRLFYTDAKNKLLQFDISEKTVTEFDRKRSFPEITAYTTDDPTVLYLTYRSKDGKGAKVLSAFNPDTLKENILIEDAAVIHGLKNSIVFYTDSNGETFAADLTNGINCPVCRAKTEICGFEGNRIIYTRNAPTADNKNLYVFTVQENAQEELVAANIFDVCRIYDSKIYYTVGNKLQKSLYCLQLPDRTKTQLMHLANDVAYIDSDAVYAVCGDAYNRVLYRIAAKDGKKTQVADNVRSVIGMHCGRLHYIDTDATLCSVNTDGTDLKTLFADTEKVLLMQAGVLYFLAADDVQMTQDAAGNSYVKQLLSLYSIHADGSDLQKIVHGAADVQCCSDTEIDFFKSAANADGSTARWLFRYDTKSGNTYKLLEYSVGNKKGK